MWLPHEVPVMFCHKLLYRYTRPLPRHQQHLLSRTADGMVTTIYYQKEQQRTNGFYHYYHYYCLLITGRTVGLMLPFSAKNCSGTREGGETSLITLKLSSTLLHCYLFCFVLGGFFSYIFPTHFIKIV